LSMIPSPKRYNRLTVLRIRQQQLGTFERIAENSFADRLVAHLRQHHGDVIVRLPETVQRLADLPEPRLQELVRHGIARAHNFGLTLENTIGAYVAIMFAVAPNFDQMPIAAVVRRTAAENPDQRIHLLLRAASADDWEGAEAQYDPTEW